MTTIIAGRFTRQDAAAEAVERLIGAGFPREDVSSFFVNPAGQHDRYPIGGDEDESPGTHAAGPGAATGAAGGGGVGIALGAAAIPILGPAGPAAGAAIGAYIGALVGALDNLESKGNGNGNGNGDGRVAPRADVAPPRRSGMLVAVAVPDTARCTTAVDMLRVAGADELEHAEGTIRDGEWIDFDPLQPVALLRVPLHG
jgi:hypothetical protein